MKPILAAIALAVVAAPAFADRIKIEDDGWARVPAPASAGFTVEIDDDGWTRLDGVVIRSDRGASRPAGSCSQMEMSIGLSGAECGVLSMTEVISIHLDD